jgi:TPR repeat protein
LVLEKLKFFQAARSRLDAGEREVGSPVPSETVASFVKMVEGKPIAITDEDFIPLLVLSDESGFQELSDACQEFADDRLFQVAADQRNASERCRESGVGGHQAWIRAAEFFRGSAEQGHADEQWQFGCCLELGHDVAQDLVRAAEFSRLSAEHGHEVFRL